MPRACAVCPQVHYAKGYCQRHYLRNHRHGDPHSGDPLLGLSTDERFWSRVEKTDTCWLWTGAKTSAGYGSFGAQGRVDYPHRYAYRQIVGPIPAGLELDHLCQVRHCLNPDHLEPVTPTENKRRIASRRPEMRLA